jgi:TPR repeat protein
LLAARQMLVVLTPTSVKSENVRDEISYALKQGKTVIPVLYMECVIPLRLERKQHIDFRADYARGLTTLLKQLDVEHPNEAVLDKAAEGDARRQLAWKAREAEAERLRIEEQTQREEAGRLAGEETLRREREAEAQRLEALKLQQEKVEADRLAREAEAQRQRELEEQQAREQAKRLAQQEASRREREAAAAIVANEAAARRDRDIDPVGSGAALPAESVFSYTGEDSSWTWLQGKKIWIGSGVAAAILILAFVPFHKSLSPEVNKASQPNPAATPPPRAALVQPTPVVTPPPSASPSRSTAPPTPARDPRTLALQGDNLFAKKRYKEALPLLTEACDAGNPLACKDLGYMYFSHLGVPVNPGKGVNLWTKACDGGDGEGCQGAARAYKFHLGVTQDDAKAESLFAKAINLLTKACDGGSAAGCERVGNMYMRGVDVPQDVSKAFTLLVKACNGANAAGCRDLGQLYCSTLIADAGVPRDLGKAFTLFNKACDGGDAQGCFLVSNAYGAGQGVAANPDLARQYLQKGCNMDSTSGCNQLKAMQ